MKNKPYMSRFTFGCLLLVALSAVPAVGQPAPVPPALTPEAANELPTQTVEGMVDGFNRDPRGHISSVVVKTTGGKLNQFNLPPDLGDVAMHIASEGQKVTAVGSPEMAIGDRTIYRLSRLTGPDGNSSITAPTPGAPEPTQTVQGTVRRLNISDRGEVDGAMLDSGDYIHTGSRGGVSLMIGGKLLVVGTTHPMADGHQSVEAMTINGLTVRQPPVPARPLPGPVLGAVPPPPMPPIPAPGVVPPAPDATLIAPPASPPVPPVTAPTLPGDR